MFTAGPTEGDTTIPSLSGRTGLQVTAETRHNGPPDPRGARLQAEDRALLQHQHQLRPPSLIISILIIIISSMNNIFPP